MTNYDPAAPRRFLWLVFAFIILWPALLITQFNPLLFFESTNLQVLGNFLGQFFPPQTARDFLQILFKATLETLAIATAGITLALIIAIPLGLIISQSLSISRIGPANGHLLWWSMRYIARIIMMILRGVPEIVWALLLVRVFGLGVTAGVLAIAVTYGGMLGKVYSEILESSDTKSCRVLLQLGSGRIVAFFYGLLPGVSQELASYTIYRWECALRASVVMGFVGAGGLGQLMDQSMKLLNGSEVSSILIVFLLLVLLADWLSYEVRRQLL